MLSFPSFLVNSTGYGPCPLQLKERNKRLPLWKKFMPLIYCLIYTCSPLLWYSSLSNMSTSTSSLSDTLPSTVPLLDAEGSNWAIFYIRFMDAIEAKGFWEHFDGSMMPPVLSESPTAAEIATRSQWDKNERSAKALLTQWLPDSTVMEIHAKKTVREHWEAVVRGLINQSNTMVHLVSVTVTPYPT